MKKYLGAERWRDIVFADERNESLVKTNHKKK